MPNTLHAQSLQDPTRIFILTVGGCGEFGMNLTIYLSQGVCIFVDCGLSFAEAYEIGVDAHIPDWNDLTHILGCEPTAYLITHGHEDHVGALPYFLAHWPAPVYVGPWALELLKSKLNQLGDNYPYVFHQMLAGESCRIGHMEIDWVHVPHSIPHSSCLVINAGQSLKILHTGDFKLRGYAANEADLPLKSLQQSSKKTAFLAMLADSTNAQTPGHCPSEDIVLSELTECFAKADGLSFITTFSSNLWRIKTVLKAAKASQKKVLVFGAGIRKNLELAAKFRLLGEEFSQLIDEDAASRLDRKNLVVLCSGCQGEYRSGLRRIVNGEVSHINMRANDQVIFSSRVIPGNEKAINKITSTCHKLGVKVISGRDKPGIHVSGHAYAEDLRDLIASVNPKFYMPVHGTFTQIKANQALAPKTSTIIEAENGQLIALNKDGFEYRERFELGILFVDSWSRLPMSYDTMRERHKIGDSGLALASGKIGPAQHMQIEIDFVGLPFSHDEEEACELELIGQLNTLHKKLLGPDFSIVAFNEQARLLIRRVLTSRFVKKPVVMSKIYLADR